MRSRYWQVMAVLLILAGGCSSAAETTADEAPGATPEPTAATSVPESDSPSEVAPAPESGSDAPRVVPPLVVPSQAPGSDEAYDAMIAELERFTTDEQLAAGVPWPELRNPDPVAAYQSCAKFQGWMAENNPTPSLVEAYTAPESPERGFDLDLFDSQNGLGLLSTPNEPPYSMRVVGLVHPAATDITDALLEQVPDGSIAVVYWDSVGQSSMVDSEGEIYRTDPGWVEVGPWVSIMAPTDVGWRVWWDELTETPPPGLDDGRGLPDTEPPRQDV